MRKLSFCFIHVAWIFLLAFSANPIGQYRPVPPGLHEGERQINKPLDPPLPATDGVPSSAKLRQEANELAELSARIPSQIGLVAEGRLPKDLADKLKRIEKLAKHLREELSR